MSERTITAAVIIIGNEILSGRTQDTNLRDIALTLNDWGIRVMEARVIADVEDTIVSVVNDVRARYDYVFTTGGIGPTHDDITAASIAKAFGVQVIEQPQIAALIRKYPASPDVLQSRLRMALVPAGAGLIENTTGGAPAFFMGNVYVLAGVPAIMRVMLASLRSKLIGGPVMQARSIIAYLEESAIAAPLRDLQNAHPQVEIGSYPFFQDGRVGTTLVMRSTDEALLARVTAQVEVMVAAAETRS